MGLTPIPGDYKQLPGTQKAGPAAFAPFPADTSYFERPEQSWMLNFRVRNLDGMVKQLRDAGIAVKVDPQPYPNGRFARLHDPGGNPIELWQLAPENENAAEGLGPQPRDRVTTVRFCEGCYCAATAAEGAALACA